MQAEIIASGTELLLGEIIDTNTPYIASQLAALGIDIYHASIVGDNYERFLSTLKLACQRSDIVIITGGLGPTKGDITRDVIAGLLGEQAEIDPELKRLITDYFNRINRIMPENNLRQATLIPSAIAIPNPLGTAPGWWVKKNDKLIISLPGPPAEMQLMWDTEIRPRLKAKGNSVIVSFTLKTWGLSEAAIDQMVGPFMDMSNPTLALYAKTDGIYLRITAKSVTKEDALALIRVRETELRAILKDSVWGVNDDTLEKVLGCLLLDKKLTVAVAESFTGGRLSCALVNTPESRHFFRGGIITVDDGTRSALDIRTESPSVKADRTTAARMAILAREKFSADIGVAIDGYPGNLQDASLCQAFLSISLREGDHSISQTYPGRPSQLAVRAVNNALYNLRKVLQSL